MRFIGLRSAMPRASSPLPAQASIPPRKVPRALSSLLNQRRLELHWPRGNGRACPGTLRCQCGQLRPRRSSPSSRSSSSLTSSPASRSLQLVWAHGTSSLSHVAPSQATSSRQPSPSPPSLAESSGASPTCRTRCGPWEAPHRSHPHVSRVLLRPRSECAAQRTSTTGWQQRSRGGRGRKSRPFYLHGRGR
jgi:hypothetical protein